MQSNFFGNIILAVLLAISSITDIREKEISLRVVFIGILAGILFCFCENPSANVIISLLSSIFPGIFLIGISILSEGKVGLGDGLVGCMGGLFLGFEKTMKWLFVAFVLCALYGIGLMMFQKKSRKTELAFVPFLFIAMVGICFKEMVKT